MRITTILAAAALACAGLGMTAAPAQAQVIQEVSFQGRLTNAGGTPITATTSITFQLYTQAAGGSSIWTETQNVTPNANGVYSVRLGSVTAFPGGVTWNATYYLGLTVSSDAEMVPRYQLTSSAFALRASRIGGLTNTGLNASVTDANLNALTGGGGTSLHTHVLADGATDVTVTATILNQLSGSSLNVTGANLSTLTAGGASNADTLHTHNFSALSGTVADAQLSANVAFRNTTNTFALGQTFTSLATFNGGATVNSGATINGGATLNGTTSVPAGSTLAVNGTLQLGGTNLTVTAAILNQLSGSSANVTGANLSALTGGGATGLHTHFGQAWSGTNATAGLSVTNTNLGGAALYAETTASGAGSSYGIQGHASGTLGSDRTGVRGTTNAQNGFGLYGANLNANTNPNIGVMGTGNGINRIGVMGDSANGRGVSGLATGTGTAADSPVGVFGASTGTFSVGAIGAGVRGEVDDVNGFGGSFENRAQVGAGGNAIGVEGISTNATAGYGVVGRTAGGRGVYGTSTGTAAFGVYGDASGISGRGVWGSATNTNGIGVWGTATSNAGAPIGVFADYIGATGAGLGLWARANNTAALGARIENTGGGRALEVRGEADFTNSVVRRAPLLMTTYTASFQGASSSSSGAGTVAIHDGLVRITSGTALGDFGHIETYSSTWGMITPLNTPGGILTCRFVVFSIGANTRQYIMCGEQNTALRGGYGVRIDGSTLRGLIRTTGGADTLSTWSFNIGDGAYYSLAVVVRATNQIEVFIDGVSRGVVTGTIPATVFHSPYTVRNEAGGALATACTLHCGALTVQYPH